MNSSYLSSKNKSTALNAVKKFIRIAFPFLYHQWTNTAKSHISWGISWNKTAKEVDNPAVVLIKKLAQIITPSIKLWKKSQTKFIIANGCGWFLDSAWWQWFQWITFSIKSPITIPHKINVHESSADISPSDSSGKRW
jgi:hypothetical protein